MMGVGVRIDDTAPTSAISALRGALGRRDVQMGMGREVRNTLVRHFNKINSERKNPFGARRYEGQGFYRSVAQSVQQPVRLGDSGVRVSINHVGIAQRYYGGTITAKPGGALTIPVHPMAYGKRAPEIPGLVLVRTGNKAVLMMPQPGSGFGTVFYILVKSVTQKADRRVLPEPVELEAAAVRRAESIVRTILARRQGGGLAA